MANEPRVPKQLVRLPPRATNQPLPKTPGVYLYSKAECTGNCFRLDGYCPDLERETGWPVKSAYVVKRGHFWDRTAPAVGVQPSREVLNGPRKTPFAKSPKAANKLSG